MELCRGQRRDVYLSMNDTRNLAWDMNNTYFVDRARSKVGRIHPAGSLVPVVRSDN